MNVTLARAPPVAETATARVTDLDLRSRIRETVQLMDRRGYGVGLEDFSRLLYGGSEPPAAVALELGQMTDLSVEDGLVVRRDRSGEERSMRLRQSSHGANAYAASALADDFAARLLSTCPLARMVSLSGSLASGGFDPGDDIDVNIIARDGSKYTVYLWALALSAVTSLRNRGKPFDEMSALPFLPKIICINVVWERGQMHPFVRQDKWLAYELLMHRPILGAAAWSGVLKDNPWMATHFPQVFGSGFVGGDRPRALQGAGERRHVRGFFAFLDRHASALAVVEALSRVAVIAIHRLVSLTRSRKPQARDREAFVNLVKRPYSVFDVPGREVVVPPEALLPRPHEASPQS